MIMFYIFYNYDLNTTTKMHKVPYQILRLVSQFPFGILLSQQHTQLNILPTTTAAGFLYLDQHRTPVNIRDVSQCLVSHTLVKNLFTGYHTP